MSTKYYEDDDIFIEKCPVCGDITCISTQNPTTKYVERKMRRKLFEYNSFYNDKKDTYINETRQCHKTHKQLHLCPL